MSDDRRLSDWVLREGSDPDRAETERRLAGDPALRARALRLQETAEALRGVPGAAWEAIGDADAPAVTRPRRRWWPAPGARPSAALAAALAAVVFAAGVGAGALISGAGGTGPPGSPLALRPLAGGPASAGGVAYLIGGNRLELVISHLPATAPSRYYEAWLMTSLRRLIPLASFHVDRQGRARLDLPLPAAARSYRYIDVSLQSAGAGAAHSAVSVLRGPTSHS
ncbi:MAG: anti-sigma factor [Solirubrobacteraceae bacterium]